MAFCPQFSNVTGFIAKKVSLFVTLCDEWSIATTKRNGHLTFGACVQILNVTWPDKKGLIDFDHNFKV